jgi:hypothetical protein
MSSTSLGIATAKGSGSAGKKRTAGGGYEGGKNPTPAVRLKK